MARVILTVSVIILLGVSAGCQNADAGRGAEMPPSTKAAATGGMVPISKAGEMDLIEDLAASRAAYRRGLELLVDFYYTAGNNMKKEWAEKELKELDAIPQYRFVIDAEITGPNLRATESIAQADDLYTRARKFEKDGSRLIVIRDKELLRMALDGYNEVIRRFPTSDKIDDCAYQAAGIYDYFKDYSIAVTYYERTFQWNSATTSAARFKAAWIYDDYYHNREKALELYKAALETTVQGGRYDEWREFSKARVAELSVSRKAPE